MFYLRNVMCTQILGNIFCENKLKLYTLLALSIPHRYGYSLSLCLVGYA
jgi:hypothetical protein